MLTNMVFKLNQLLGKFLQERNGDDDLNADFIMFYGLAYIVFIYNKSVYSN